jgi:hypothetical protein
MASAITVFNPDFVWPSLVVSGFPHTDVFTASITYKFPMAGHPDLLVADFPVPAVTVMTRAAGIASIPVVLVAAALSVVPVSMPVPVVMAASNPDPDPMIVTVIVMVFNDGPCDDSGEESTEGGQGLVTSFGLARRKTECD